jgi:hypothetical protein
MHKYITNYEAHRSDQYRSIRNRYTIRRIMPALASILVVAAFIAGVALSYDICHFHSVCAFIGNTLTF